MLWANIGLANLFNARYTAHSLVQNWSTTIPPVGQFFYTLLLVIVVAAMAYYTTRLLGSARFMRGGRRNLEILESLAVGPQSFVHVLRVGEQYVLVGVTRGQVTMLTQLEADQLKLPEGGTASIGFESLLSRFQKKDNNPENGDSHDNRKSGD